VDPRARATIERCQAFIADKDDALSLPPESAQFVHAVVLGTRARRCLEIGTSYGHSGLWIAAAAVVNGGSLVTIDREDRKSRIAADFFAEAGLSHAVTCRTGDAGTILSALEGPFDFVLNDADKENYCRYVEMLCPKLPPGAVVLSDNVLNVDLVREQFVPWVHAQPAFFSTLVTVGNGLEMSVKLPG
jgi:predicted O-methyltransferase YrrM